MDIGCHEWWSDGKQQGAALHPSVQTSSMKRRIMRLLSPASLVAAALGLGLSAQIALADNLAQMLYDVYDHNPDIRAEEYSYKAKQADTRKSRAALLPKIDATGGHSLKKERLKSGKSAYTRTSQYGVKGSQRLFNGFQSYNNLKRSRYEERSGRHQLRDREAQILLEAVTAYMDVYAARHMINLRRRHVANMEKQRRATRARIRAGELTRTDLSKTDALLYRARASLEGAVADLGGATGRYESLAGYQPGELIYPQMPTRYLPKSVEEAEHKALSLHPQLRASQARTKARQHAVSAAKGAFLPTVDLSGEHTRNFSSSHSKSSKAETNLALRLSLPLFDGGARLAEVQKAKAEHNRAKYSSNAVRARIKADARENFLRNRAAQTSLKQARSEVKAAKDLLRGIRIEEKAGQRSFLDILDAEIALLDARELEIYAQAESVIAIYRFLASTGQLTVSGARKAELDYQPTGAIAKADVPKRPISQKKRKSQIKRVPGDPWSGMR